MRPLPTRALTAGAPLAFALAFTFTAAGCHDAVTEIVVVVDTDLSVPNEVEILELDVDAPSGITRQSTDLQSRGAAAFPATVGLLPGDAAGFGPFTVTASLLRRTAGDSAIVVASRKASGVRFVRGAVKMLYLPLPRSCACEGTTCPNALDPACADLTDPPLAPFDPGHLPRVTPTDGGATADGGAGVDGGEVADAEPDVALEAPLDGPPEARLEAGADRATSDAATDAPRDAVAEAAPPKLPRGHACVPGNVCQDGFCVDGFCCESACTCGTCNATPGHCATAAAGADPHGDCGAFACNGAGACETTCAESFGGCSTHCSSAAHCDGAGSCVPSTTDVGLHCIVGSCMCKPGLTCPAPDGGGAGACQ